MYLKNSIDNTGTKIFFRDVIVHSPIAPTTLCQVHGHVRARPCQWRWRAHSPLGPKTWCLSTWEMGRQNGDAVFHILHGTPIIFPGLRSCSVVGYMFVCCFL